MELFILLPLFCTYIRRIIFFGNVFTVIFLISYLLIQPSYGNKLKIEQFTDERGVEYTLDELESLYNVTIEST